MFTHLVPNMTIDLMMLGWFLLTIGTAKWGARRDAGQPPREPLQRRARQHRAFPARVA